MEIWVYFAVGVSVFVYAAMVTLSATLLITAMWDLMELLRRKP